MHASPTTTYLCSLSEPSWKQTPSSAITLTPSNLLEERHRVIESGLTLIDPLKGTCLYHTLDWFTYSLCFGEGIRQFRAAPNTAGPGRIPSPDPKEDAYILGRWRDGLEVVGGRHRNSEAEESYDESMDEEDRLHELSTKLGISPDEVVSGSLSASSSHQVSDLLDTSDDENGTELMQLILFSSNSLEQRYLSQVWSDGTLCDINHEPRSVEVQYHCVPGLDNSRIALIKETTTCKYVLVVETPLTCQERELSIGRDEGASKARIGEWRCRRVIDGEENEEVSSVQDMGEEEASPSQAAAAAAGSRADQQYEASLRDIVEDQNTQTTSQASWPSELPGKKHAPATTAKYFAAQMDDRGNIVLQEINDADAQAAAGEVATSEAGSDGSTQGGGNTAEKTAIPAEATLKGLLQNLLDQIDQQQAGGGGGEGPPAMEIQLDQDDLMALMNGRQGGAGGVDIDANELQGAIAKALEGELKKLKDLKTKGGNQEEGGASKDEEKKDTNKETQRKEPKRLMIEL